MGVTCIAANPFGVGCRGRCGGLGYRCGVPHSNLSCQNRTTAPRTREEGFVQRPLSYGSTSFMIRFNRNQRKCFGLLFSAINYLTNRAMCATIEVWKAPTNPKPFKRQSFILPVPTTA